MTEVITDTYKRHVEAAAQFNRARIVIVERRNGASEYLVTLTRAEIAELARRFPVEDKT